MTAASTTTTSNRRVHAVALFVALITALVFVPALANDFVRLDDQGYVLDNRVVHDGLSVAAVRWSFTTFSMSNWHPLTWLSYLVDASLFGIDATAFHATSVFLHALCAALVVLVVRALVDDLRVAAAVALLFALHPLRVESVAWVSERKDVLSGVFFFLTLLWYVKATRRSEGARLRWHAAALVAFALGLLAKPMLVTVPPLLVVIDACFLDRFRGPTRREIALLVVEKLPYLALAACAAALTVMAQGDAIVEVERYPLGARLANAAVSYARYLQLTVWPAELSILYPLPADGWPAGTVAASIAVIGGVTALLLALARRGERRALGGWLWFLGVLVPVIGIVHVGDAARADRYTYLPHVGLFLAVVLAVRGAVMSLRSAAGAFDVVLVLAFALAFACVPRTVDQIGVWSSSRSLFTHAIAVSPEQPWLRMHLASALVVEQRAPGDVREAIAHGASAISMRADDPALLAAFGSVLAAAGELDEAERALRAVLEVDPQNASARAELERIATRRDRSETHVR